MRTCRYAYASMCSTLYLKIDSLYVLKQTLTIFTIFTVHDILMRHLTLNAKKCAYIDFKQQTLFPLEHHHQDHPKHSNVYQKYIFFIW